MIGAIGGTSSYYGMYLYNSKSYASSPLNRGGEAQSAQASAPVLSARRAASPETPVQPVPPVTPSDPNQGSPTHLGPFLREGADPVEMAVRMRITPYQEDPAPAGLPAVSGESGDQSSGVEGVQQAVEEGKCQTCEERKYQDGSDDMGVSFQTPTRIDPDMAASAVRGHEMEHVVREQSKAQREDRKVVSQTVTLHTDICPECGKAYISGGTTRTTTAANQEQPAPQTRSADALSPGLDLRA